MALLELTEVFRQKDESFVALLNEIRDGTVSNETLAFLNSRVGPAPRDDASSWVWVCATNAAANAVNHSFLGRIPGDARTYKATVQGSSSAMRGMREVATTRRNYQRTLRSP
jgi:ATP-dependent DNA helicase PIF1